MKTRTTDQAALELAVNLFRQWVNDPDERYWGTTLIDAFFPIVETFDIETDCTRIAFCYGAPERRADAEKRLIMYVQGNYRRGEYPTGHILLLYGSDCVLEEIEWSPSEEDRYLHNIADANR